jgi:hypothetical protein
MNIYIQGNYILFLNEAENVLIQRRRSTVEMTKTAVSSDIYEFYSEGVKFLSLDFSEIEDEFNNPFSNKTVFEDFIRFNTGFNTALGGSGAFYFVSSVSELPKAQSGIITLKANATYYFTGSIDLLGSRLLGSENTVILGASSENSRITSTGLGVGVALFTTEWTTPIRHVTFQDVDTALNIDGSINPPLALDWTGVNFLNVPNVGKIDTADNFIFSKGAFLNSQNLQFDGSHGTIGIDNSIFVGSGSVGNMLDILSTATITRRFRLIYSSLVVFGSTVGINVNSSATIPTEGYILDTINFSGGGTYLSGVDYTDNKTRFVNSKGIENTAEIGNYFMTNNAISTVISTIDTPVKVLGATTANTINQKFTHTDNRLTYVGALIRDFQVTATVSLTSGNNNIIGVYVAKNGTVINSSEMYSTTSSGGRSESITCQTILELNQNDYVEIFVENSSSTTNITVEYLNVICKSLN